MERVDAMPDDAYGLLLFGRTARLSVAVCVVGRRIGWATSTRLPWRLTDLIALRAGVPRSVVHVAYQQAAVAGDRVGEWLVRHGEIEPGELRMCLHEQASHALALISPAMGPPVWTPADGDPPEHTLSTARLRASISPAPRALAG
ncbi:MAG: hypothetical protein D6689_09430 [Deltaproteobacteria bacterium]|nr:MAG: hypothetical protein D6689_09430 [Deltaproteobacteria bacterium]